MATIIKGGEGVRGAIIIMGGGKGGDGVMGGTITMGVGLLAASLPLIGGGVNPEAAGLLNSCGGDKTLSGLGATSHGCLSLGLHSGVLPVGWATGARPLPGMSAPPQA